MSLGALVHPLDPARIPFRKATQCAIHVSGGEFNCAANLADGFGLKAGIVTAMVDYPIGDLIAERVKAMGVIPFYKRFAHDGVRGPNMALATACATGTNALGEAVEMIRRGAADVMLAGAAEAAIHPLTMAGMNVMTALSTRNHEPERASRPFDKDSDGFLMGEGAATLVLESLDHAQARGAKILCEFAGYVTSDDAHHISAPAENHASNWTPCSGVTAG